MDKVTQHFYTNTIFLNNIAAAGSAMHTDQNKLNFTASKTYFYERIKKQKTKQLFLKLFRSILYVSDGIKKKCPKIRLILYT